MPRIRTRAILLAMSRDASATSGEWVVVLRHLGIEREILVLKAKGQEFHAFCPNGKAGGDIEVHSSYHGSGERHLVMKRLAGRSWIEDKWPRPENGLEETMRRQTATQLQPPAVLRGTELLFGCNVFAGQFPQLKPVGTNSGEQIVIDAEAEGFRDDFTMVRAYLVGPSREETIPANEHAGPRVLHLIKRTTPWLAVEVFQLGMASH